MFSGFLHWISLGCGTKMTFEEEIFGALENTDQHIWQWNKSTHSSERKGLLLLLLMH